MSPNINDLPVELLVEILRYVGQGALQEAILTCKKWEEVIRAHFTWNVHFFGRISAVVRLLTLSLELNRKLNIAITLVDNLANISIDIFKQIGCDVTHLHWSKDSLSQKDSLLFLDLLKCFPNLEYMHLCSVVVPKPADNYDLPDLKKLKTFKTDECNVNIVRCFRTSTLNLLEMKEIPPTRSTQHLADFVRCQENLTKLYLNYIPTMFFQQLCDTTPNHRTIPFTLHHLIVDVVGKTHSIGLYNFFKIHLKTLKKLDLCGVIPVSTCKLIFSELKSLKILVFDEPWNRTELNDCLNIKVNFERLQVHFNNFCPQALKRLCESVPNVKTLILEVNDISHRQVSIISTTLTNITTMYVKYFGNSFNDFKFPNLTSFHVKNLRNEGGNWDTFTKNNCRITVLCIEFVYEGCLTLHCIEAITRNLKLHILKIGRKFSADKRFIKIIRKNCSNLEVLDLCKSCGLEYYQWDCFAPLRLRDEIYFPSDFLETIFW